MSTASLIRWSGLSALVGGVLYVVLDIAFLAAIGDQPESVAAKTSAWVILLALSLVATALVFLGLVGLYARQARQAGALGLIAFLAAFVGMAMYFSFIWAGTFIVPALAEAAPDFLDGLEEAGPPGVLAAGFILTFILYPLGWLLFGLVSLLGKVLPRWAAVLLMVGAVLGFVLGFLEIPINQVVLGIALAWMGVSLWSEKPAMAAAPAM